MGVRSDRAFSSSFAAISLNSGWTCVVACAQISLQIMPCWEYAADKVASWQHNEMFWLRLEAFLHAADSRPDRSFFLPESTSNACTRHILPSQCMHSGDFTSQVACLVWKSVRWNQRHERSMPCNCLGIVQKKVQISRALDKNRSWKAPLQLPMLDTLLLALTCSDSSACSGRPSILREAAAEVATALHMSTWTSLKMKEGIGKARLIGCKNVVAILRVYISNIPPHFPHPKPQVFLTRGPALPTRARRS